MGSIKEKIIEILEDYTKAVRVNEKRFIPEDYFNKIEKLLLDKVADQILALLEEEKEKWIIENMNHQMNENILSQNRSELTSNQ